MWYNFNFNKKLLLHINKIQGGNDVTLPELNVYVGLPWIYKQPVWVFLAFLALKYLYTSKSLII